MDANERWHGTGGGNRRRMGAAQMTKIRRQCPCRTWSSSLGTKVLTATPDGSGSDTGANCTFGHLTTVMLDLGVLQKGHPKQAAFSSSLSKTQIEGFAFHSSSITIVRGSPIFNPQNVLTGNAKMEGYFTAKQSATCNLYWRLAGLAKPRAREHAQL